MITPEKKSIDADVAGLFWESRVAEATGVARKILAQLRGDHLQLGRDFVRQANNAVAYTAEGLARMESLIAREIPGKPVFPGGKPPSKIESPDIPAGPPEREWMVVERVPHRPGLLLCVPCERPGFVTVRVRDAAFFRPGMKLEAIKSGDGVWQFRNREGGNESTVGRLPRNPGRW